MIRYKDILSFLISPILELHNINFAASYYNYNCRDVTLSTETFRKMKSNG